MKLILISDLVTYSKVSFLFHKAARSHTVNNNIKFELITIIIIITFVDMQQNNPASYSLLTKDLDTEQQTYIMSIMSTADQHLQQLQQQPIA